MRIVGPVFNGNSPSRDIDRRDLSFISPVLVRCRRERERDQDLLLCSKAKVRSRVLLPPREREREFVEEGNTQAGHFFVPFLEILEESLI